MEKVLLREKRKTVFGNLNELFDKLSKSEVVEIPIVALMVMIEFGFGFGTWHDLEAK